ncbi:PDDEXK nuclease domain-containing protein [Campylobacter fetus]|uniref:PDDEXK nuclease domain-containing protein n=1 Tax=Campylobacter fetus TaxID=196 RepID=UPI00192F7BAE|nr:PDDEXK nuclease domain-containing protein [Campylobacter fetus]
MNIEKTYINKAVEHISNLIYASQSNAYKAVNQEVIKAYWEIGKYLQIEILDSDKSATLNSLLTEISNNLKTKFGRGFDKSQISRMIKFYNCFIDFSFVATVSQRLGWSHFVEILPMEPVKREFYITICANEGWSVRTLRERVKSMLFERTAISNKPELTIKNDLELLRNKNQMSENLAFRDPYVLDFLGLSDTYSEKELESAILVELQKFITELGSDFAFIARQKRITIDAQDYYIDLLFYHRKLRSLVAIELKLGKFEAGYKGQMELYLRWLERHEMLKDENPPIGLILCSDKNNEHIELLQLDKSNIKVAKYMTKLPQKELLEAKLKESIKAAKEKLRK